MRQFQFSLFQKFREVDVFLRRYIFYSSAENYKILRRDKYRLRRTGRKARSHKQIFYGEKTKIERSATETACRNIIARAGSFDCFFFTIKFFSIRKLVS